MVNLHIPLTVAKWAGITCAMAVAAYKQPYRPMVVVGKSMSPTYANLSVVMTEPVRPDQIRAGEVVVIDMPTGPIVKRIAYAPGDKFLQVNNEGDWIDLIYVRPITNKIYQKRQWREYTIPQGMVYVLGDNQEVSYDSKEFGCVPVSHIHRVLVDQRQHDLFANFKQRA
jgi:signal peptidase I